MRNRPEWMNEKDDIILEFLQDTGATFTKKGIEVNLILRGVIMSYSTIKRRTEKLEENGFIEVAREKGKYYQLSDKGEDYLG